MTREYLDGLSQERAAEGPRAPFNESPQTIHVARDVDAEVRDAVEDVRLRRRAGVGHEDEPLGLVRGLAAKMKKDVHPAHVSQYESAEHQVEGATHGDDRQSVGTRPNGHEVMLDEGLGQLLAQ